MLEGPVMKTREAVNGLDLGSRDGIVELESLVKDHVGGRLRNFCLLVVDGGLILRGRTGTYYAKQLAQQAVMRATNRPILANEIEVF